MRRTPLAAVVLTLVALVLAGCGSDDDNGDASAVSTTTATDGGSSDAAFPVTVEDANGEVTVEAEPERIVSLAPSLTETLFAVGAGDQVVAVDDQSDYPEGVPSTDLSGYEPNVEAIGGYEPDLVVFSDDPGDLAAGLQKIGVQTLVLPAATDLEETYRQIEVVGDATGHADEADDLVDEMKTTIKDLEAEVPEGEPVTYFHELDDTLYTVTSSTFIGQLYEMAGFENIADPADTDGSGYPQLSAEFLIEQDPQAIFLADGECCGQTPETVAARPGWSTLRAVQDANVFVLDDDVASRWGPRVVDLFEDLVAARQQIATAG